MSSPYETLAAEFGAFAHQRGVALSPAAQLDALAAFLSSQMLLFAGPSGTGKSTLARLLADFFTERLVVLEAETALVRQQEAAGYASALRSPPAFVETEHTAGLLELAESAAAKPDDIPVLLVEEGNLSPIEGYLRPFLHGLARPYAESARWTLHNYDGDLESVSGGPDVPPQIEFGPWPRVLVTINVDATSPAPAPKVVARSGVLLLEPPERQAAIGSFQSLFAPSPSAQPPGRGIDGDPRASLNLAVINGQEQELQEALDDALKVAVADERNLVSPRAATKALMYVAAYAEVASRSGDQELQDQRHRDGAENALLHFVLPTLDPAHFGAVAESALEASRDNGLLRDRLERLHTSGGGFAGVPDDFWSGLS